MKQVLFISTLVFASVIFSASICNHESSNKNFTYSDASKNFIITFTISNGVMVFDSQSDKNAMKNYFNNVFGLTAIFNNDFAFTESVNPSANQPKYIIMTRAESTEGNQLSLAIGANEGEADNTAEFGGDGGGRTYTCTTKGTLPCSCCGFLYNGATIPIGCTCETTLVSGCNGQNSDCNFTSSVTYGD